MATREDGVFLLPAAPDVDSHDFMLYGAERAVQAIMNKAAKLGIRGWPAVPCDNRPAALDGGAASEPPQSG